MKTNTILCGDALETLRTLPAKSVQTCVTSPPYYALRDYGTAEIVTFHPDCKHDWYTPQGPLALPGVMLCRLCLGEKHDRQIGLESTPAEYIAKLVEVFREVKRVLRDDGTLWINIGDTYARGRIGRDDSGDNGKFAGPRIETQERSAGLPDKNLLGIPWRLAFALQDDNWVLRNEIIWAKGNPMPESVQDRCTRSHETIFLLSKQERYYYDAQAIAEPLTRPEEFSRKTPAVFGGRNKHEGYGTRIHSGNPYVNELSGRNKRDVWHINTTPYPAAHFAVMPTKLVEPCILAGSRTGDVVLDPFCGAGTVLLVASQHHRHYLGIELNPAYVALAEKRIREVQPVLWEVGA